MKTKISIICALSENRAIGKNNKLLWDIPDDLKRFKELTTGHPIIMGRKTFESIGSPLPGRTNIIITRDSTYIAKDAIVVNSLEKAIEQAKIIDKAEVFIIGGGQIYNLAIKFADKLYLTIVEGEYEADTFFPDYSAFTKVVFEQQEESEGYKYKFINLEK